ncbi:MAG: succinylglutamate desuccinylase/aspartoacylase family protein [Planctomycetia bacterium]|nr:succinylglutamate desuccinylase/aspartoacylase family protein [Planctomycetia bacterium]
MTDSLFHTRTIVGQASGPHLLLLGGVHGDEFEPMAALRLLLRQVGSRTLRGRLTMVPVVNEAAFARGTRTAEDGLDLARTFPGRPDGSITQRVAHAAAELIRSADFLIDLHTGGTVYKSLPFAGHVVHADPAVLNVQRQMARAFNLPIIWGGDPRLQGRSLSVARDASVPAIYAEYHGAATCSRAGVEAYTAGCLNVMACLGMIDRASPECRVECVVEDNRPEAGHMQMCNPAPMAGFFEPAVELGDRVRPEDVLGTVTDALGEQVVAVRARQQGLVLVLRTFPRVNEGDMLAVILETDPWQGARP